MNPVNIRPGKTGDSWERPLAAWEDSTVGVRGLAAQHTVFVKGHYKQAPRKNTEIIPQGHPRGGEDERPKRMETRRRTETPRNMISAQSSDSPQCHSCGKLCKNAVGLKIHQSKMGCAPIANLIQRAEEYSGETEERPSPELHHRTGNLNVPSTAAPTPKDTPARERVNWLAMNDKRWEMFETDAVKTLEVVLKGNIAARLETLPTILHTIGKEMFGMKTTSSATGNTEQGKNRRELKIEKLRLELKKVKRHYKCSLENEKPGLAQIRNELRSELRSLRKAEHDRNKRRRRARARAAFMKGPFNFVKTVLGNPRSGKLESEMVDVEQSRAEAHNDIRANAELDELERQERSRRQGTAERLTKYTRSATNC